MVEASEVAGALWSLALAVPWSDGFAVAEASVLVAAPAVAGALCSLALPGIDPASELAEAETALGSVLVAASVVEAWVVAGDCISPRLTNEEGIGETG